MSREARRRRDYQPDYQWLLSWAQVTNTYPRAEGPEVDFHRLQIEYLIWTYREHLARARHLTVDIGGEYKRPFAAECLLVNSAVYATDYCEVAPDVRATVTALPFRTGSLAAIICTETLEHVPNLFRAVAELKRTLRPRGLLLASAPWMWPDHAGPNFGDFWRLSRQAWQFLFADFQQLHIWPLVPRNESLAAWPTIQQHEVMGEKPVIDLATGYFIAARK